jgi:hypothetical protein
MYYRQLDFDTGSQAHDPWLRFFFGDMIDMCRLRDMIFP